MSKQCAGCKKYMSARDAAGAVCPQCKRIYHRGCVLLSEVGDVPKDWACTECKAKEKRSDNTNTPARSSYGLGATAGSSSASESNSAAGIAALRRDLDTYMAEQREFREEIRTSLRNLTTRLDGVELRLEAVEKKAAELEAAPQAGEVVELQQTVARLQQELYDRDQDALLSDLDIGHVPEEKGKNVVHTVTVLATKLGVALEPNDVVFAERVGVAARSAEGDIGDVAGGRPRRIVVRLARRQLRDQLLQAARVRRTVTSGEPPHRVYFNERLTRANRLLFHRVREEGKKQQWRFVWTKRGRVYARQGDGKQAYYFRSDADIERVFGGGKV